MIEWTVIEWDLATPLREELRRGAPLRHIDVDNQPAQRAGGPTLSLRSLGRLVEEQLAKGGVPERVNRREPHFLWAVLQLEFAEGGPFTPAHFDAISKDPLLHQRLFDVVQEVFRGACQEIARQLRWYDDQKERMRPPPLRGGAPGRAPPPAPSPHDPLAFDLAVNIRTTLLQAQHRAVERIAGVHGTLGREVAGKEGAWGWVKVAIGFASFACCVAGVVALATASSGVLLPFFIALGATGGTRSLLDTLKATFDRAREAETIKTRLNAALTLFQAAKARNGAALTAKAIANATVKFGAVGYDLLGCGRCASLHDIADDIATYEAKLDSLRADAHDAAKKLNEKLDEQERSGLVAASQGKVQVRLTPEHSVMRTRQEAAVHKLIIDVSGLHARCDQELKNLPVLKRAVAEVIQSNGKVFVNLEKYLDLGMNGALTLGGVLGGAFNWGGWSDAFTVLGGAADVVLESDQAASMRSSRCE